MRKWEGAPLLDSHRAASRRLSRSVRRQAWLPGTAGTRIRFAGTVAEPADRWATGHGKDELTRISHNYDVFSSALSLPVGVFSPALLASSVASDAAISVCFAPEDDCAAFAVRTIDNAEREILIGAYGVITGSGIVEALVRAKERGVDVRLIAYRPPFRAQRQYRAAHRGGNVAMLAYAFLAAMRARLRPGNAASDKKGERCLVRPGRRNVDVIAARTGCVRAIAMSPA